MTADLIWLAAIVPQSFIDISSIDIQGWTRTKKHPRTSWPRAALCLFCPSTIEFRPVYAGILCSRRIPSCSFKFSPYPLYIPTGQMAGPALHTWPSCDVWIMLQWNRHIVKFKSVLKHRRNWGSSIFSGVKANIFLNQFKWFTAFSLQR